MRHWVEWVGVHQRAQMAPSPPQELEGRVQCPELLVGYISREHYTLRMKVSLLAVSELKEAELRTKLP